MTLTVTGRHVELSPVVRQQIEKKFQRIERLLNASAVSAQCVVGKERQRFVCEITVHARGDNMLVGIGRHERLLSAVGAAVEKVSAQAQRLTGRWKTRRKDGTRAEAAAGPVSSPAKGRGEAPAPVVRARRYAVKVLSTEQAAVRMGTAAFLVFRHADTGRVAVVFRRPDGRVGLIDPED